MLMVDGVELVFRDKFEQVRKLHGDDAGGGKQDF